MKTTNVKQANQIRGLKSDIKKLNARIDDITSTDDVSRSDKIKTEVIDFLLFVSAAAIGVMIGGWIAL